MKQTEYHIQVAVVNWIRSQYPKTLLTISPSGMKLRPTVAFKIKCMGYLAGTPDLLILEPRGEYHGLFVELKAEKGKLTTFQKEFLTALSARGYYACVAYGFKEAVKLISNYLNKGA